MNRDNPCPICSPRREGRAEGRGEMGATGQRIQPGLVTAKLKMGKGWKGFPGKGLCVVIPSLCPARAFAAGCSLQDPAEMRWEQPGADGNAHLEKRRIQADLRPLPVGSKVLQEVEREKGLEGQDKGEQAVGQWGCSAPLPTPHPEEAALSQIPLTSCLHTNVILS